MITTINWAKLVSSGRAKAIGVSWTEEELAALKSGISVEDVRAGVLSKEEIDDTPKLERMKRDDLMGIAREMGIVFDDKAITRETLIIEIRNAETKAKDQPEIPAIPVISQAPAIPAISQEPEAPETDEETQG